MIALNYFYILQTTSSSCSNILNLGAASFDCKVTARVIWWEATYLQTVRVQITPTAITLRQSSEGLQVTAV